MHQARALGLGLAAHARYRDGVIVLDRARCRYPAHAQAVLLVQLVDGIVYTYYRDGEGRYARGDGDRAVAVVHHAIAEGDRAQVGRHRRAVG